MHAEKTGSTVPSQLQVAAEMWQTPTVEDGDGRNYTYPSGDHSKPFLTLAGQGEQWSTPRATDGEKGGPNQQFGAGGVPLAAQSQTWASPTSRDHKGGANWDGRQRDGQPRRASDMTLADQAESPTGPQDPPTETPGGPPSPPKRTLNPLFVEWLMGLPRGWVSPGASTDCERWETRSALLLRHLLSAFCGSPCLAVVPIQRTLFDMGES